MIVIPWGVFAAVLIGHFGLSIAAYNRINALGIPRNIAKTADLVLLGWLMLVPPLSWYWNREPLADWVTSNQFLSPSPLPLPLVIYGGICLATWIVLGIPWLIRRPLFGYQCVEAGRQTEVVHVEELAGRRLALTAHCRLESRIPGNQIFELAIEAIELPVAGLPAALDGYRIAHLADIHLPGHIHPEFSRYAVERASRWHPDLMALTGDIIDKASCIEWLPEIFGSAYAEDGCYYVLGNHDTRVRDSRQTRHAMDRAGWTDLGSRVLQRKLRSVPTMLIGNEHPWFKRPELETDNSELRLLLSHSPDQIWWARKHGVTLMLAGHTHGGQGRLPLAGPILGPSLHGSRFASGDFYLPPTTMHVTRGLCGTHLIRINCRPELSLLTLRSIPGDVGDI